MDRYGSGRRALLASLVAAGLPPPVVRAQAIGESQARAAALLSFARYVEWPAAALGGRDFVFCLVGREPLAGAQAMLEGKPLHGRTTVLRRVVGPEELRGCQVVYFGDVDDRRLAPMLKAASSEAILSVGDAGGFLELGGGIALGLEEGRIRFDINRSALDAAGLKASANLLKLARNLRGA